MSYDNEASIELIKIQKQIITARNQLQDNHLYNKYKPNNNNNDDNNSNNINRDTTPPNANTRQSRPSNTNPRPRNLFGIPIRNTRQSRTSSQSPRESSRILTNRARNRQTNTEQIIHIQNNPRLQIESFPDEEPSPDNPPNETTTEVSGRRITRNDGVNVIEWSFADLNTEDNKSQDEDIIQRDESTHEITTTIPTQPSQMSTAANTRSTNTNRNIRTTRGRGSTTRPSNTRIRSTRRNTTRTTTSSNTQENVNDDIKSELKENDDNTKLKYGTICAICKDDTNTNDRTVLECGHAFHTECIQKI